MQRCRLTALVALLAFLAPPGAAFAQSAGDEQYQDPFAQDQQSEPDQGGSGGDQDTGGGGGGVTQPAPEAPASEAAPAQTEGPAETQTLPNTGFPAALGATIGVLLLAGGAVLRVAAWSPPRDGRGGMLSLGPGALASGRPGGRVARSSRAARARARRRAWRT
jgi:hypothetical protein